MRCAIALLVCSPLLFSDAASAFTYNGWYGGDPQAETITAARWSNASLADGLQVNVAPGFAAALSAGDPAAIPLLEQAVIAAFAAWESPALRFDITFEAAAPSEVNLVALPNSDPLFSGNAYFGLGYANSVFDPTRAFTNGTLSPGRSIVGGEISIAIGRTSYFARFLPPSEYADYVQRLFMHEIGHILGFGHVNELGYPNYDTDLDPTNAMPINPTDPGRGLIVSPNRDAVAVMNSNVFLGPPVLTPDDIAGRDALYPSLVAEPSGVLFGLLSVCALGLRHARRRG